MQREEAGILPASSVIRSVQMDDFHGINDESLRTEKPCAMEAKTRLREIAYPAAGRYIVAHIE
jgi:hypothetical protein